jgi:CarboxypepD_reg-like domain
MNRQQWIITALLVGSAFTALSAQTLEGKVVETGTGKPVAFANIGIYGKSRGTVSDEHGAFSLNVSNIADSDTLRFSILGYDRLDMQLSAAKKRCEKNCKIELTPKIYDLKGVEIVSKKNWKERIVGNDLNSDNITAAMSDSVLGHEFGTLMKIKRKPAVIEEVVLHVARCTFDTVFLRMNISSTRNGKPDENLLKVPVYVQFSKEEVAAHIIKIDMSQYGVRVQDDFLVSFEVVKDLGDGELALNAGLFKDKAFYRATSQAKWMTLGPLGIGISAKISQEK